MAKEAVEALGERTEVHGYVRQFIRDGQRATFLLLAPVRRNVVMGFLFVILGGLYLHLTTKHVYDQPWPTTLGKWVAVGLIYMTIFLTVLLLTLRMAMKR